MVLEFLRGGDFRGFLVSLLLSLPIVLLSLSVHETAHGYAAYRLGDPTARNYGRLSLNPIKHIDPIGFLCMVLFGFGWAKPVPINTRYFKKPRRDMALSGLAGPVSNLLLAVVFALLFKLVVVLLNLFPVSSWFGTNFFYWMTLFFNLGVSLNVTLAVFNLLPIPPLDGSRLVFAVLPPEQYFKFMRYERYISIALMVALLFGLLDTPIFWLSNLVESLIYRFVF